MNPRLARTLAHLYYVEALHHQGAPASWSEHESRHVVRRDPAEGRRLMVLAERLAELGTVKEAICRKPKK
jgi:hypothetical protein